jgi:hypothetical protein
MIFNMKVLDPYAQKNTDPKTELFNVCKPNQSTSSGSSVPNKLDANKVSERTSVLSMATSEARQQLQQRGEKLAEVGDKSQQLADQSREFANIAKQLRQKQASWF